MKDLLTLILLITLCSCKEDKQPIVAPQQNVADTIKAADKMYKPVIKNKLLYSKEFLEYAKKYKYTSPVKIIGDRIEVDGQIIEFPSEIEMNKEYLFTAVKGDVQYELTVKRYTPADISYEFRITITDSIALYSGIAHIGLGFWLGSESENDDATGTAFLFDEYHGITEDGLCSVTIGIGKPDDNNRIRAVFELHCDNETQNRNISADVTLRQHIE